MGDPLGSGASQLMSMVVQPTLLDRIREKQGEDPDLEKIRDQLREY